MAKSKRSEIAEDPIHEQLSAALKWTMDNRNLLIALGVVFVLIVAGGNYYLKQRQAQADDASALLLQGLTEYNEGDFAAARAALTELLEERSGTPAAQSAQLFLANTLYELGEIAAAKAAYEASLQKLNDPFLRLSAREGIAACTEEAGLWTEAATLYREVAVDYQHEESQARNLLAAARCLATSGDPAGARAIYLEIEETLPALAIDARVARALLGPVPE